MATKYFYRCMLQYIGFVYVHCNVYVHIMFTNYIKKKLNEQNFKFNYFNIEII